MTTRTIDDIRRDPQLGDVIEFEEQQTDPDGVLFMANVMLRVVAAHESKVWCKEYGAVGHRIVRLTAWFFRLHDATNLKVVKGQEE